MTREGGDNGDKRTGYEDAGTGQADRADRREALRIVLGFALLAGLVALAAFVLWPEAESLAATYLEPGLGVKGAFAWGFGITFAVFVVFAVVAGDGLLGELTVMLGAFLAFWVIFSLSLAWIF